MEVKKTSRSNLENKRFIFREIGFIVALSMVFFAFETKYYQEEAKEISFPVETSDIEEVLPVFVPQRASQPLPKISVKPLDFIEIVENEMDFENEMDVVDDNENTKGSLTGKATDWQSEYGNTDETGEGDGDIPFITVEKMPRFNGDLNTWLRKNLRYPARCAEMGIGGKVFIEFVVEKDGSISSINVVRSADPDLSQEAIRVVKAMPKWIPGMQRDKAVRVRFTIPITFQLR
ncbi:energy transducer TonB [Butyricimonas faecalis]|uniref:Energy transducer TonB n=1 Tax=Butyricimonas faecalis TaxID=2093856 RepID=A0A3Q9INK7_9BACT|nr:energy transducer TonB [Butyricimonas faecalis]AZS30019.1 energy transducer TonB [Butyricimonas faecalis]